MQRPSAAGDASHAPRAKQPLSAEPREPASPHAAEAGSDQGVALTPAMVTTLQRRVGNRATASLVAERAALARRGGDAATRRLPVTGPNRAGLLQRKELTVGKKKVVVNDYHFLHRMHMVKRVGVSMSGHTVLLDEFDAWDELAMASVTNREGQKFSYGGFTWLWRGEGEIVPTGGARTVNLSGMEIEALVAYAKDGVDPSAELTRNRFLTPFTQAFQRLQAITKQLEKSGKEDDGGAAPSALRLMLPANMPEDVRFAYGKGRQSCFLWHTDGGSKEEYPHIHAFFSGGGSGTLEKKGRRSRTQKSDEDESVDRRPITEAVATLRPTTQTGNNKRHWSISASLKVVPKPDEGTEHDDQVVIEKLERLLRAIHSAGSSSTIATTSTTSSSAASYASHFGMTLPDFEAKLESGHIDVRELQEGGRWWGGDVPSTVKLVKLQLGLDDTEEELEESRTTAEAVPAPAPSEHEQQGGLEGSTTAEAVPTPAPSEQQQPREKKRRGRGRRSGK
jgi:hypothetical protein